MRLPAVLLVAVLARPSSVVAETKFIYGPNQRGGGLIELTEAPERVVFTGRVHKAPTHDVRVLGGAHPLVNRSGVEYRVLAYEYSLDQGRLSEHESVETDVALTILPPGTEVSLSSGSEMLVTHQYDSPFAPSGKQRTELPGGGFRLLPGHALSAGTVSAILPNNKSGAAQLEPKRLSDGRFMSMYYKFELVRADLVEDEPVTSYRSPYRDRSYVPDANRTHAPYTDYRNTGDQPVHVHGIGVFLSNMSSYERSAHSVRITLDGEVVTDLPLPPHIPGKSSPALPLMMPLELVVRPGQTIGVRGFVDTERALVFDFAAYLIADVGLEHVNERLDVIAFDVNKDGYDDIVDLDGDGSIWVSVRVGAGHQNTQHEWLRRIGRIAMLEAADGEHALIARNDEGLCLRLDPRPDLSLFLPSYCGDKPATEPELWGDFNGDGWPDRFSVDDPAKTYRVELGGRAGFFPPTVWASGHGQMERWFPYDGNSDGLTDMIAQWHDDEGFQCLVWRSNGTAFDVAERLTIPHAASDGQPTKPGEASSDLMHRVARKFALGRRLSWLYYAMPLGLGALWLTWAFRPRRPTLG